MAPFDDDDKRYRVFVNLPPTPPRTEEQKARDWLNGHLRLAVQSGASWTVDECVVERWTGDLNISRRPMLDSVARQIWRGMPTARIEWVVAGVQVHAEITYYDATVHVGDVEVHCQRASMGGLQSFQFCELPPGLAKHFGICVGVDLPSRCIYSHVPTAHQVDREWVEYIYKAAEDLAAAHAEKESTQEPMNVTVAPVISPTFNNGTSSEDIERLVEALVAKHVPLVIQRLFKGG